MDKKDFSNLGEDIRSIVESALDSKNFDQLNKDISTTVNGALEEMRAKLREIQDNAQGNSYYYHKDPQPKEKKVSYTRNTNTASYQRQNVKPKQYEVSPIARKPVGRVASVLWTVFGSIGMGVTGILLLSFAIFSMIGGGVSSLAFGFMLSLFGASALMLGRGSYLRNRMKRFRVYAEQLHGRSYCSIIEFSDRIGKSKKFVIRDIRRMIHLGMFPQGHLDEEKTCFMLTRETYQQYLDAKNSMKERQLEEEQKREKQEGKDKESLNKEIKNQELLEVIEEGRRCINEIKDANRNLTGEEISKKLYRLEAIISKIFEYVEQHPDQLNDIRKFMDYYLPMTLKLVDAYEEFDRQPVQGENISTAKGEIEKTLDTINLAFENLLDSLFQDAAMDVSAEISVLQTLLAQEGLTQRDFK